jgi:proteic killer suppression protein
MIKSFTCKETEKIFNRKFSKKLPQQIQRQAYKKLLMLTKSELLEDLKIPPSNSLEELKGDLTGHYSIRINKQWRICFKWEGMDAFDVNIMDYH